MKRFCEFIKESKNKNHKDGTYVEAKLDEKSSSELNKFVKTLDIDNLVEKDKYHSTIIYSRKGIPEVEEYKFKVPFTATFKEWKILGVEKKYLVIALDSKDLTSTHKDIMQQYKATYDFDQYIPHITIANDYAGGLPKENIKMTFTFDKINIEGLDDD